MLEAKNVGIQEYTTLKETHRWERVRSNSYSNAYKCINCGEYEETYDDGLSIQFPAPGICSAKIVNVGTKGHIDYGKNDDCRDKKK